VEVTLKIIHDTRAIGTNGGGSHIVNTSMVRKLICAKSHKTTQDKINWLPLISQPDLKAQMVLITHSDPINV
jgi:hypothetical protein